MDFVIYVQHDILHELLVVLPFSVEWFDFFADSSFGAANGTVVEASIFLVVLMLVSDVDSQLS
jgi:hypothetical protein